MPHRNTYRRVFQNIVSEEAFEELMEAYHQQQNEAEGEVLVIDGKENFSGYAKGSPLKQAARSSLGVPVCLVSWFLRLRRYKAGTQAGPLKPVCNNLVVCLS